MSSTSETELSTDAYFTSSDESTPRSTGRCSDGVGCVVPPLDLSKLHDKKKNGNKVPIYSPILTKSQYAIHPPTPGFGRFCQSKVSQVDAKMREFEHTEPDHLASVLEAVTVEMLANDDEIVENNEVLYRQNMDCEHLWYDSRVAKLDKQQLRKDIDQRNWYIERSKEELRELNAEHAEIMKEDKKLKNSNEMLRAEIESLETDITELDKRKNLPTNTCIEQITHAKEEGLKIASENEIRKQSLARMKKRLSKCRHKSSSSVTATSINSDRNEFMKCNKLPPINRTVCRESENEDDTRFSTRGKNPFSQGNTTCARLPKLAHKRDKKIKHLTKNREATEHVKIQRTEKVSEPTNRLNERMKAQNERNSGLSDSVLPPIEYEKRGLGETTRMIGNNQRLERMLNKDGENSTRQKKERTKLPRLV